MIRLLWGCLHKLHGWSSCESEEQSRLPCEGKRGHSRSRSYPFKTHGERGAWEEGRGEEALITDLDIKLDQRIAGINPRVHKRERRRRKRREKQQQRRTTTNNMPRRIEMRRATWTDILLPQRRPRACSRRVPAAEDTVKEAKSKVSDSFFFFSFNV